MDPATAARLLSAVSDVTLVLAPGDEGVIREVSFGNEELENEFESAWLGKPWLDVVTVESRGKVEELIRDAANDVPARWRQVNHQHEKGIDHPVLYTAMRLGDSGAVMAVGRSLRPMALLQQQVIESQQAMDREYLRLRQAETRHRLLFEVSSEAVMIVDAASMKVLEANPSAQRAVGAVGRRIIGRPLIDAFDSGSRAAIERLLEAVRATGRAQDVPALSASATGTEFFVSASLFREGRQVFFLVRLAPAHQDRSAFAAVGQSSKVIGIVESSPDAFVVTDLSGRIIYANRAFLDGVQLASAEQVRDEPLERWLGTTGVDFNTMASQLHEHGLLRLFPTTLQGQYGTRLDVEVCAVEVAEGEQPCTGYIIREIGPRRPLERADALPQPRTVEQIAELVGRVPLKELVRESTDMIERLCIESALRLAGDNRASAAEMLGLSRQSLYAKLRRYGLGDLLSDEEDDPVAGAPPIA